MKQINSYKLCMLTILVLILSILVSCGRKDTDVNVAMSIVDGNFSEIDINMSIEYYDSIVNALPTPEMIVLKETDDVMFADIDRIIAKDDMYYILDSYGASTVVSFTTTGKAYAKYGKIGQGPGEYIKPWDIDVDSAFVYVLDSNTKKILQFEKDGTFVKEKKIPFIATSFKRLINGDYLFSILADGDASPRLCRSDSMISNVRYCLPSKEGYLGGLITNDIFRQSADHISFYQAPLDTMYYINNEGLIIGGLTFNFGDKKVPGEAQLDFLSAMEKGILNNALWLVNNPIELGNGLMVGTVEDGECHYTILLDSQKSCCGARKCDPSKSIYEMIAPCTSDSEGRLICYTSLEYIEKAADYDLLNDSIKAELKDNNRILLRYSFL